MTKTVTVNNMAFPVIDQGAGRRCCCCTAFLIPLHVAQSIGPLLAADRVIVPDLRGFGDAPKPAAVELSPAGHRD